MKKRIYLTVLTMLLTFAAFSSQATTVTVNNPVSKEAIANMTAEQKQARIEEIKQRVNAIRAMDKSQLTKDDRKELRTELKSLKQESRMMGGGVYLSVGAIIIIILLLILIL
jgi:peptidoglycan hydrolase CwlO-like protein